MQPNRVRVILHRVQNLACRIIVGRSLFPHPARAVQASKPCSPSTGYIRRRAHILHHDRPAVRRPDARRASGPGRRAVVSAHRRANAPFGKSFHDRVVMVAFVISPMIETGKQKGITPHLTKAEPDPGKSPTIKPFIKGDLQDRANSIEETPGCRRGSCRRIDGRIRPPTSTK